MEWTAVCSLLGQVARDGMAADLAKRSLKNGMASRYLAHRINPCDTSRYHPMTSKLTLDQQNWTLHVSDVNYNIKSLDSDPSFCSLKKFHICRKKTLGSPARPRGATAERCPKCRVVPRVRSTDRAGAVPQVPSGGVPWSKKIGWNSHVPWAMYHDFGYNPGYKWDKWGARSTNITGVN